MLQDELTDLESIRLEKIKRLREEGIEPFPARSYKNATTAQAIQAFENSEAAQSSEPVSFVLAGRLRALRNMGKLSFAHIEDRAGRVQLLFRVDELGQERLADLARDFDLGDFIEASGSMFRTKRGEVTLQVEDFRMLAKALRPLPAAKTRW